MMHGQRNITLCIMHVIVMLRPPQVSFFLQQSQELLLCIEFPYTCVRARGESTATDGLLMTQLVARFIHLIALRFPGVKRVQDF